MTAVKAQDVVRALKNRRDDQRVLLFYGRDAGRIAEGARAAAQAGVDDPKDPFQLVRLDGDLVAEQPGRLPEEVSTFGMFGGRRAIWVRPTSRSIAAAVSAAIDVIGPGTLLVIEAGDLARSSPLRAACEAAPTALALPCYPDETRDVGAMVREILAEAGLSIDDDARELLVDSLGGDRLASLGELSKLTLYCMGRTLVTVEDVMAAVSDVSSLRVDAVLDACMDGRLAEVEDGLRQLAREGVASAQVLSMALTHALALLASRTVLDSGQGRDAALRSWRGLSQRRRDLLLKQLGAWTTARLRRVVALLQDAVLESRRTAPLADTLTSAVLMRIAMGARSPRPAASTT